MRTTTKDFIQKHKKQIIIGTTVIAVTAVAGVVVYKKWDMIKGTKIVNTVLGTTKSCISDTSEILDSAEVYVVEQASENKIIDIDLFVRNLPDGWSASPKKLEQAKELGIALADHQTLVNPHIRHIA